MDADALHRIDPPAPLLDRAPRNVKEAVQGFEALFLTSLLEQVTRGSDEEGGLVGNGPGSEVLRGLVEQTLAEQISRAGGVGLAERITAQFDGPGIGADPTTRPALLRGAAASAKAGRTPQGSTPRLHTPPAGDGRVLERMKP